MVKILAWWWMSLITALHKAEVGKSLSLRSLGSETANETQYPISSKRDKAKNPKLKYVFTESTFRGGIRLLKRRHQITKTPEL